MPSAEADELPRVVIDETSFDLNGLHVEELEMHLFHFNEVVWDLREDGISAWKAPMFESTPCSDNYELPDYLMSGPGKDIDRDVKLRFFSIVDKCPEWDAEIPGSCTEVSIADGVAAMALSIACALALAIRSHGTSCLVFGACERRGFIRATAEIGESDLFFFAEASALKTFWRQLYELENATEEDFFVHAARAFPNLIFHDSLAFRHFEGNYRDLRSHVVQHLGILNDYFLDAHSAASGIPQLVEAALAIHGCAGVSPESPTAHRNDKLMRSHKVEFDGKMITCEWHTKVERHRNRIYFAFGGSIAPEKILVGVFTKHL